MDPIETWGIRYNQDIPYAPDHDCQNPGCDWSTGSSFRTEHGPWWDHVVGFSPIGPPSNRPHIVGILIFECPKCFHRFWFHIDREGMELLERLAKESGCPQFKNRPAH